MELNGTKYNDIQTMSNKFSKCSQILIKSAVNLIKFK